MKIISSCQGPVFAFSCPGSKTRFFTTRKLVLFLHTHAKKMYTQYFLSLGFRLLQTGFGLI